jgi:FixJ family two-component response regulator
VSEAPELKVYVVDDDEGMRESLCWLIESAGHKVETFVSAGQFMTLFNPQWRGCLILDVRMPVISGLELQQQLNNAGVLMPVIMISGFADVPTVVNAMQAGAMDFLEKPFDDNELLQRIDKALMQTRQQLELEERRGQFARLTDREKQILESVKQGMSSRKIAEYLGISTKTVETHRANMMHKLQVGSVAELVSKAWQAGI